MDEVFHCGMRFPQRSHIEAITTPYDETRNETSEGRCAAANARQDVATDREHENGAQWEEDQVRELRETPDPDRGTERCRTTDRWHVQVSIQKEKRYGQQ